MAHRALSTAELQAGLKNLNVLFHCSSEAFCQTRTKCLVYLPWYPSDERSSNDRLRAKPNSVFVKATRVVLGLSKKKTLWSHKSLTLPGLLDSYFISSLACKQSNSPLPAHTPWCILPRAVLLWKPQKWFSCEGPTYTSFAVDTPRLQPCNWQLDAATKGKVVVLLLHMCHLLQVRFKKIIIIRPGHRSHREFRSKLWTGEKCRLFGGWKDNVLTKVACQEGELLN